MLHGKTGIIFFAITVLLSILFQFFAVTGSYAQNAELLKQLQAFRERSIQITKQYLDIIRRSKGTRHPDYLDALVKYGDALRQADRPAEARKPMLEALRLGQRLYGKRSPRLLKILNVVITGELHLGNYKFAEPLAEQALSIAQANFSEQSKEVAFALSNLGNVYKARARFVSAEKLLEKAARISESLPGLKKVNIAIDLNNLSEVYKVTGRYNDAFAMKNKALNLISKSSFPRDRIVVAAILNNMASIYKDVGALEKAAATQRAALDLAEKYLGRRAIRTVEYRVALGTIYHALGRNDDAEKFLESALNAQRKLLRKNHPQLIITLNNIAQVYQQQEQPEKARPYMDEALRLLKNSSLPEGPTLATLFSNFGLMLGDLERVDEGINYIARAVAIREKVLDRDHVGLVTPLVNLGLLHLKQNNYSEAERHLERAVDIATNKLGPEHPLTALSISRLSRVYIKRGSWEKGYKYASAASELAAKRLELTNSAFLTRPGDLSHSGLISINRLFSNHIHTAYEVAQKGRTQKSVLYEKSFEAAQWATNTSASRALSQMTTRISTGNDKLADLVREQQDLLSQWQAMDQALTNSVARPSKERDGKAELELRKKQEELFSRLIYINQTLAKEFPSYSQIATAKPVSIKDIQSSLEGNEAAITFFTASDSKEAPGATYVWVITKSDIRWRKVALNKEQLEQEVQALRCGLDLNEWNKVSTSRKCRRLLNLSDSVLPQGFASLPYDVNRAFKLYRLLLAPDEDLIKGRELFITLTGPLTKFPIQALITERPNGTDLSKLSWMAKTHSVTILPAVSSLTALRKIGKPSGASRPFAGFGNPLLKGSGQGDDQLAREAIKNQKCAVVLNQSDGVRKVRSISALKPITLLAGLADKKTLLAQLPLPETAFELCTVANSLNAQEQSVFLGSRATERQIKTLSRSGQLAQYKILHFATHGAMAGELDRNAEPGLVFTPPFNSSNEDDGYLTSSEISQLKLDANWVILSACNTAAGQAENSEALSGMARAFIYAQARTLLVSHWAVDSVATVKLITFAMNEAGKDPNLAKSEAMRRSMVNLMTKGNSSEAHPAYWAPFIVVGEGS